jgi:CHAT domain-containing protein
MAIVLDNLAIINVARGNEREGLLLKLQMNAIHEKQIDQIFSFSSEKERFQFLDTLDGGIHSFLTLCAERLGADGSEVGLNFLLRRKGLVLDSLMEDAELARLSGNPTLQELMTQLRETKTRLATLILAEPKNLTSEQNRASISGLQSQVEKLEKDLARGSTRLEALQSGRKVVQPEVAAALPQGSALVEFAKYKSFNFDAKLNEPRRGTYCYIAYILCKGESKPLLVRLGEAKPIDNLIKIYQETLQGFVEKRTKVKDVNATSEALEKAVWAPVKAALGDAKHIYLSPDGELNFVSFAGLRGETGRYVLEDYDLVYVSSGRDLARGKLQGSKTQGKIVLFGEPDFDGQTIKPNQEIITQPGSFRGELAPARAFGGMIFDPLPGTRVEVNEIGRLAESRGMKQETNLGLHSSEDRVKALEHPRILHLATHGFFLPESNWAEQAKGRERQPQILEPGRQREPEIDLGNWKLKNPMHRSGLALAGANIALEGKATTEKEDGILTAEEVSSLDLAGTELVVLSACETGLGEAKGGEGVLGLRRAFVQAGAENLVMALWQVSDNATQELMKAMYEKYFSGQPLWKALLSSQRDALADQRKAGRDPNPYLWAGFVANIVGVQ